MFGIRYSEALSLFSARAGKTPDQVLATIDRFIATAQPGQADAHARRQAIIDQMLQSAVKAERAARRAVTALLTVFGL